jgi:hypothetical protein
MSPQLLDRSPDLLQLVAEGYEVEIVGSHLLIRHIPYVNSRREVAFGTLVSVLTLSNEATTKPSDHVVSFAGEHPCKVDGSEIVQIKHQSQRQDLGHGIVVDHTFSNKPADGYKDYYDKMTTYIRIISGPAEAIDPNATARTRRVVPSDDPLSVFTYRDTASSRAGIAAVSSKLELERVAIVGLGGTGSYVLDLVAKTPVKEIHLFDGDRFLQHNAFRSPGAASLDDLQAVPSKVGYFRNQYSRIHRGIVAHEVYVDATNVDELKHMDFVFVCLDRPSVKKAIVERLEVFDIPFVDVGMGIELVDEALGGVLRVTTSSKRMRDHVRSRNRIPFSDPADGDDEAAYSRNIQIADLNALNAALAVVKWKKLFGFYRDLDHEHFSTFTIDGNALVNEDHG